MKYSPSRAGYEPIGGQVLDSQEDGAEPGPADLKESFYVGAEMPNGRRPDRGFGHNQWPASLPGFRGQMLAYQAAMRTASDHLLCLIALSLNLPEAYFASLFDEPSRTVRLMSTRHSHRTPAPTRSELAPTPIGEVSRFWHRTTSAAWRSKTSPATGSRRRRSLGRLSSTSAT